jgi:hypothetical protein
MSKAKTKKAEPTKPAVNVDSKAPVKEIKKAEAKVSVKAEPKTKGTKKAKELSKVQVQMITLLKRPKGATIADIMKETGLEYRKVYMQILNWMKFKHPIKKLEKATFQYK